MRVSPIGHWRAYWSACLMICLWINFAAFSAASASAESPIFPLKSARLFKTLLEVGLKSDSLVISL